MKAVQKSKIKGLASVEKLCNHVHLHRDAYYKSKGRLQLRETVNKKVVELVRKERKIQPRVGTRKLQVGLEDTFVK